MHAGGRCQDGVSLAPSPDDSSKLCPILNLQELFPWDNQLVSCSNGVCFRRDSQVVPLLQWLNCEAYGNNQAFLMIFIAVTTLERTAFDHQKNIT